MRKRNPGKYEYANGGEVFKHTNAHAG
jgi:hypothetical protein